MSIYIEACMPFMFWKKIHNKLGHKNKQTKPTKDHVQKCPFVTGQVCEIQ